MKVTLTNSEKKILRKIRKWLFVNHRRYDFWFIYNENGEAINWAGGFELPNKSEHFRNQYSVFYGKRQIVKNW